MPVRRDSARRPLGCPRSARGRSLASHGESKAAKCGSPRRSDLTLDASVANVTEKGSRRRPAERRRPGSDLLAAGAACHVGCDQPVIRFSQTSPHFAPGQLVRHRRYGYRGVIAAVDLRCMADHGWYMSNKTQPELNQPWYHVLVDGAATTTYAAESSLMPDSSADPIDHPLVDDYFSGIENGQYQRNDRPWPGWE